MGYQIVTRLMTSRDPVRKYGRLS